MNTVKLKSPHILYKIILSVSLLVVLSSILPSPAHAAADMASSSLKLSTGDLVIMNKSIADLYNKYPSLKMPFIVPDFVSSYGFGGWYAETAYAGYDPAYCGNDTNQSVAFDYVYVLPGDNYTKKMVILYETKLRNRDKDGIVWTCQADLGETLQPASSVSDLQSSFSNLIYPSPRPRWMTPVEVLFGTYPEAKNNITITSFIDEHGMYNWSIARAYGNNYRQNNYEYVSIFPNDSCQYKLVFLYNFSARNYNSTEQKIKNGIMRVKLIDKNETLQSLNDNEAHELGIISNITENYDKTR